MRSVLKGRVKSRSERRREARAVEEIALELVQLCAAEIPRLPCNEDLRREIMEAQGIKEHGARKRQIKYLAKQLRGLDCTDLISFLDQVKGLRLVEAREFQELERLRGWICGDETGGALEELAHEFPDLEIKELQALAERYRRTRQRRFSREILRHLRTALDQKKRQPQVQSKSQSI